jgi:hypothetical protein
MKTKLFRQLPVTVLLWVLMGAVHLLISANVAHATVWTDWIAALQSQGFTVTQGIASKHTCDDFIAVFKDCNGDNPAGLYADVEVPVDNEYVDPCYNSDHKCDGQNIFTKIVTLPDGSQTSVNQFYRLSDKQALVLIVKLPPNAAYFGYQNYVWSRALSIYGKECNPAPSDKNPNPCRILVRANVGNAINHLSILKQSGIALGSDRRVAFITTANKALYDSLASAFLQVGGRQKLLLLEPLGAKINAGKYSAGIVTGLDADSDELNAFIRYTLPQDQTAGDNWLNAIADNIQVFRIEKSDGPMTPFSTVRIAPKNYTPGESDYQAALDELAGNLQTWLQSTKTSLVKKTNMDAAAIYTPSGQPLSGTVGPICLQKATDCRRITDDTDAYRSTSIGQLRETAIVVGIDNTQTGNAHYISLGVNRADVFKGIYSLSQTNPQATGFASGTLRGSASDFVADLVARGLIPVPSLTLTNALPKLYVAIITRDCSAGSTKFFCSKDYTVKIDSVDIPVDTSIVLTRRAYIHPGDTNGANPRYLLSPVVIK